MVTQIPVQIPASFELIMCGVLLKTPKSKAKKNNIAAIKTIQTIIKLILSGKDNLLIYECLIQGDWFFFSINPKKNGVRLIFFHFFYIFASD